MSQSSTTFQHVIYGWDAAHAATLDPLGRLVYRSNLLGSDQRITNTGGGNTSSKFSEHDPLSDEPVEVLWVKGSGGDLRTAGREHFASLQMEKLHALQPIYNAADERGPKTAIEDAMVARYAHCTFNLNPRAPSIDTPLHAFVPYRHVDHTHPNAVIAIAASAEGERLTQAIYGDSVIWLPWQRPGFDLGLQLQSVCERYPQAQGVVLGGHGLINWADDDHACYVLTLELIERAAAYIAAHDRGSQTFGGSAIPALPVEQRESLLVDLLPWLRGQLGGEKPQIATIQATDPVLEFVGSADAPRLAALGTSCPDHFLRTKIKPLYVPWNPHQQDLATLQNLLSAELVTYRADYRAYYEQHKLPDSPAVRDPNPTVVLLPGIGMVAWGKDKSESRVTAEFYTCAVEVMRGAETVSQYVALPQREAFDIEYWLLEEAKLRRMPPEAELARSIIAIVGAGSGIGREVARRLSREGAHLICIDRDLVAAEAIAAELSAKRGMGIGVAGSGMSGCGPIIALPADITNRESIRSALQQIVLAYGGLDGLAVTAGVIISSDTAGRIPDGSWAVTFAVNVTGSYLVADEASAIWRQQGLPASLVLTTSANAVVPKAGSLAYDTSKAAANHLVRELAVTLSPLVRVNAVAPATVVEGSAMFPRDRVIASLTKYHVPFEADESDDSLRGKLAQFYADRTLLKRPITPADQAEAYFVLLSRRLSRTSGQIIAVDGGLSEAFLR
ncbi:MAG: bifunctional rhamnulose-1-phosphate aldolase/short-chain dehydrogenase [Roseiflexaceae bacterium]|nr:bifunctional rhamnulose-1-phosphate aldolase/short-chain dehydrogenase [Roseiflexaceae bacterium]